MPRIIGWGAKSVPHRRKRKGGYKRPQYNPWRALAPADTHRLQGRHSRKLFYQRSNGGLKFAPPLESFAGQPKSLPLSTRSADAVACWAVGCPCGCDSRTMSQIISIGLDRLTAPLPYSGQGWRMASTVLFFRDTITRLCIVCYADDALVLAREQIYNILYPRMPHYHFTHQTQVSCSNMYKYRLNTNWATCSSPSIEVITYGDQRRNILATKLSN